MIQEFLYLVLNNTRFLKVMVTIHLNKQQLKARATRIKNNMNAADKRTSYEKQTEKRKSEKYYDPRKRIE